MSHSNPSDTRPISLFTLGLAMVFAGCTSGDIEDAASDEGESCVESACSTNGTGSGGGDSGGPSSGGAGTGGVETGGSNSSGSDTGGTTTNGPDTGGSGTGGVATGGSETGGAASGGNETGGSSSGGGGGDECTDVRPTGTEWDEATCPQWASETSECGNAWMVDNNYCDESCGRCTSSGSGGASTGGNGSGGAASGGAGSGGGGSTCSDGDLQTCSNQIGSHCGYTYEYWKDQGTGCLTNTADGFSVEWSNINNLLGRKGVRPGSSSHVVTYSADYNPDGNSYLCAYGWSEGPLAEWYIVDSWGSWRPPGGQGFMGTVQSDGGTYDIYRTERVDQPSIQGTATFYQYWSVRQTKRESGNITVGNHFAAWDALGMNMGSLYETSMLVEGYQSSGSATVVMSVE